MTEWLQKLSPGAREGHLSFARAILQSNRFLCRILLRKLLPSSSLPGIKPSELLYHTYTGEATLKFYELDALQETLLGTDATEDFDACLQEHEEEDRQRALNSGKRKHNFDTEEVTEAREENTKVSVQSEMEVTETGLVSFNKHKFVADVYEAMVGVLCLEWRFDLRAIWEVIRGDFQPCEAAVKERLNDVDFNNDYKARIRQQLIATEKHKIHLARQQLNIHKEDVFL